VRKFDLVVIGAGIGGGSLVYNLLKQGFTCSKIKRWNYSGMRF